MVERDHLVGVLDIGSVRVATGMMGYKHSVVSEDSVSARLKEPGYLLKILPHVDGTPRVCELVRYRRSGIAIRGAWTGPSTLELHPHALAPLADLPCIEILSCIHYVTDFILELGEVAHDYLV